MGEIMARESFSAGIVDEAAPSDIAGRTSTAFSDHEGTTLGKQSAELSAQHPGKSGFVIIRYGRPAFTSRVALTELAEKSLDLQYYIWEADATGRILAERLVRAADRGVRVRVLLDDINLSGRDARIAALNAHPNIEIRLFNPFANRKLRALDFLTDLRRVNHRMHNKVMIADNAVAIVGGRNIGNHYFEAHTESNFRDLDIGAVGPLVREVSDVFDVFWDGDWAVPIAALVNRPFEGADLASAVADLRERIAADHYPFPLDTDLAELSEQLSRVFENLVWAPGEIVWDHPSSIRDYTGTGEMHEALYARFGELERELLIESAYFVPGGRGIAAAKRLCDGGIKVRVLTNSLASNDVLAAHAGYAKHREQLIRSGVEVYELRPDAGPVGKQILSAKSKAALHTKAIVFDRKDVFIGSFNLDPRSAAINTEAGLYVRSPELAEQVIEYMNEGVSPENAYQVLLDDDKLRWLSQAGGQRLDYKKDPTSTWRQRVIVELIKLLPVEQQL
jgi:cardiolipin synthase C